MQTTDKNFEMLQKAYVLAFKSQVLLLFPRLFDFSSNNILWSFPEAASFICFIASLLQLSCINGTVPPFLLSFAAITQLIASLSLIIFHSTTLNFAHFHQHSTLFFSADESDFARSLVPETLFWHQISKPRGANSLSIELNSRWKETSPLSQKDSEARFHELQFIR